MLSFYVYFVLLFCVSFAVGEQKGCSQGLFTVESPFGTKLPGFVLSNIDGGPDSDSGSVTTDENGHASLCVANGLFTVQGLAPHNGEKYQNMYIQGYADGAFNYTTYYGTRLQSREVLRILDVPYDLTAGWVVVGIDVSDDGSNTPASLQPAIGAHADMTELMGTPQPYVFRGTKPTWGNTITPDAQSFITFINVPPAADAGVQMGVGSYVHQDCQLAPGLPSASLVASLPVIVHPDSITIISYICVDQTN
jgi:hypothetical protein